MFDWVLNTPMGKGDYCIQVGEIDTIIKPKQTRKLISIAT